MALVRDLSPGEQIVLNAEDGRHLGTALVKQIAGGRVTIVLLLPRTTTAWHEAGPPASEQRRHAP